MEKLIVVHVVKNQDPVFFSLVLKPVMEKFENICLRVMPGRDLDSVCNIATALLETGRVTCVDPEYPCLGRPISYAVCVFDGNLRFSSMLLAADSLPTVLNLPYPT